MTISKLIEILQETQENHGDVNVSFFGSDPWFASCSFNIVEYPEQELNCFLEIIP
jgi:hypothetical protein